LYLASQMDCLTIDLILVFIISNTSCMVEQIPAASLFLTFTPIGRHPMPINSKSCIENGSERRIAERHALPLRVRARQGERSFECQSHDLSTGGVGLQMSSQVPFSAGDSIDMELFLPGINRPIAVEGQVRWSDNGSKKTLGVQFTRFKAKMGAAMITSLLAMIPITSSATPEVPEFDPNFTLDLDKYRGEERPNANEVLNAFERQFEAFDQCVRQVKKNDHRIVGDAEVRVLLNPHDSRPLGINQTLPKKLSNTAKGKRLAKCLRKAIAQAHYPKYNGPPVVVDFEFEIDPGFEEISQ